MKIDEIWRLRLPIPKHLPYRLVRVLILTAAICFADEKFPRIRFGGVLDALGIYSFHVSLGGQPLFRSTLLHD